MMMNGKNSTGILGKVRNFFLGTDAELVSAEEAAASLEKNYRWNYTFNMLDGAAFWFGSSFISATTIMPLFITKLTDNPLPITIMAIIAQSGWSIPQLFSANLAESVPRYKYLVSRLGFILERTPIILFITVAAFLTGRPTVAVTVFLFFFAWFYFGAGYVGPAWNAMLARVIPVKTRGNFLGLTMAIGGGMGVLGAAVASKILDVWAFPQNFTILFTLAAIGTTSSWVFISMTREPAIQPKSNNKSSKQYLRELPQIIRNDHNFRNFLISRGILALGGMGYGFITVSVINRWDIPDSMVGIFTSIMLVGQTIGNIVFGRLADWKGHKLTYTLVALFTVAAYAGAWLAPSPEWFYLVFSLLGIAAGGTFITGTLMVMDFCEEHQVPTYSGITNTLVGILSAIAPAIGGAITIFSYPLVFMLSTFISLAGTLLLIARVKEPRTIEKPV
ncbi:MAG: MFS transporter [Anaerolineales bacterium]|nr:MFS transporter [Anaerolineales bacterium]